MSFPKKTSFLVFSILFFPCTMPLVYSNEPIISSHVDGELPPHYSGEHQSTKEAEKISRGDVDISIQKKELEEIDGTIGVDGNVFKMDASEAGEATDAGEAPDAEEFVEENPAKDPNYNVPPPVSYPKFEGRIELEKPTLGCSDVLLGPQVFSDPAITASFAYVYSQCLMEMVLQRYLKSERYMQKKLRGLIEPGKKALAQLQMVLPSYLLGLQMLIEGFKDGNLRAKLDEARNKYRDR